MKSHNILLDLVFESSFIPRFTDYVQNALKLRAEKPFVCSVHVSLIPIPRTVRAPSLGNFVPPYDDGAATPATATRSICPTLDVKFFNS